MKFQLFKRYALVLALTLATIGCTTAGQPVADEPRIGVQLWSVRDEVKKDFDGTLTRLAGLGFKGVEFVDHLGSYGDNPQGLRALIDRLGMECISAHVTLSQLTEEKFDHTTRFYKTLGCSDLIIGWDRRAYTTQGVPQVAAELRALSDRLGAVGMRIGYHNHDKEMAGAEGKTPWDILAATTPEQVILQQDVGWTRFAGKDPVAVVKRHPGRSVSMHYKPKFAPGVRGTAIIGQDGTDWAGLTAVAKSVGNTRWLIVEHDDAPEGMGQLEAIAASMRGLQAALAAPAQSNAR